MKTIKLLKRFLIVCSILISIKSIGQTKIDTIKLNRLLADKFATYDLSVLFNLDDEDIVAFIGSDYQRLQIHFSSVSKDPSNANTYLVKGKTKVKENICDFNGKISIIKMEEDELYSDSGGKGIPIFNLDTVRECSLTTHYVFNENPKEKFSGVFEGNTTTGFYVDRLYNVHYDDLMGIADSYSNSQSLGTWTSYDKKTQKKCNWGVKRVPDCGDLDEGTGEFVPKEKYISNGWQEYCWLCPKNQPKKKKNWWE